MEKVKQSKYNDVESFEDKTNADETFDEREELYRPLEDNNDIIEDEGDSHVARDPELQ